MARVIVIFLVIDIVCFNGGAAFEVRVVDIDSGIKNINMYALAVICE